jgi:CBS domain-containing protein
LRVTTLPPLSRAVVAECVGTYLLVLFGTGSVAAAVLTGAQVGLWQVAVVWGFGVALAIFVSARHSGAHLNPAVTLAFALARRGAFPGGRVLPYCGAQLAGAVDAGATVAAAFWPFLLRFEAREGLERVLPGVRPRTPLSRVLPAHPPAAAPNDTLDQALQQMAEREASWLPVVEPGTGRLLGVLTVTGALQHYRTVVRRMGSLVEGTSLMEVRVEPGTPLAWQRLAAAGLPPGAAVVAVRRHGEVLVPRGGTALQPGAAVVAVRRHGEVLVPRGGTALQPGDVLKVVATPASEPRLHEWLARQARAAPAPDGAAGASRESAKVGGASAALVSRRMA